MKSLILQFHFAKSERKSKRNITGVGAHGTLIVVVRAGVFPTVNVCIKNILNVEDVIITNNNGKTDIENNATLNLVVLKSNYLLPN